MKNNFLNVILAEPCALHIAAAAGVPESPVTTTAISSPIQIAGQTAFLSVRGLLTPNMEIAKSFGWTTYEQIEDDLGALLDNDRVKTAVLLFDTPGGMVRGVEGAATAIRTFAAEKKIHAYVQSLCASAGYWLASQCSDITAARGAEIGSIGVMASQSVPLAPALLDGEQSFRLRSKHATAKNADPSTEAGAALIQAQIDATEARFHAAIAAGRGMSVEGVRRDFSMTGNVTDGGATFLASEALERGMIDQIQSKTEFTARFSEQVPSRRRSSRGAQAMAQTARAKLTL